MAPVVIGIYLVLQLLECAACRRRAGDRHLARLRKVRAICAVVDIERNGHAVDHLIAVIVPMALLVEAARLFTRACFGGRDWRAEGLRVPEQIRAIPIVEEGVFQWLTSMFRRPHVCPTARALEPAGKLSPRVCTAVGRWSAAVAARDLHRFLLLPRWRPHRSATHRISPAVGEMSDEVLSIVVGTTRSVHQHRRNRGGAGAGRLHRGFHRRRAGALFRSVLEPSSSPSSRWGRSSCGAALRSGFTCRV